MTTPGPTPDESAAQLADAASSAADALAKHLRGEPVQATASAVAVELRAAAALFAGSGSLQAAGAVEMNARATLSVSAVQQHDGGGIARISVTAFGTGHAVPTGRGTGRVTFTGTATGEVPAVDDDEPATLSDVFVALQIIIGQLDDIADGRNPATPAEVTTAILTALMLLGMVLQYARPPG